MMIKFEGYTEEFERFKKDFPHASIGERKAFDIGFLASYIRFREELVWLRGLKKNRKI